MKFFSKNKKEENTDLITPIFIGGEGRSGTSLMRVILNSHSKISCGPESQLFRDPKFADMYGYLLNTYRDRITEYSDEPDKYLARSFRAMFDSFFIPYMKQNNKVRWGEKSPHNIVVIDFLLDVFDGDIKFIHMIRDGRDVCSSILSMEWGPDNIKDAATRWNSIIENAKVHRGREYYMEVKYEDLITEPEKIVKDVSSFIGEEFEPSMLDFYKKDQHLGANESSNSQITKPLYTSSVGRWQQDLTKEQIEQFMEIAGSNLKELGYE